MALLWWDVLTVRFPIGKEARRLAIERLSSSGNPRAEWALSEALSDSEAQVRAVSARGLGRIGSDRAVELLVGALKDSDLKVRRAAVSALGEVGSQEAAGALLETLADPQAGVGLRRASANALGRIGGAPVVRALCGTLKDSNQGVREAAVRSLARVGDRGATTVLIEALDDSSEKIRKAAAKALGSIGDQNGVVPLVDLLGSTDADLRAVVAQALAQIGGEPVADALRSALRDANPLKRSAAAGVADAMNWRPKGTADRTYLALALKDFQELISFGTPAVEALLLALAGPDEELCKLAAQTLGQIGDIRAVEPLAGLLVHPEPEVGRSAAHALGQLAGEDSVRHLCKALAEQEPGVRRQAAEALGKLGDMRAAGPLISALNDTQGTVRRAAALALPGVCMGARSGDESGPHESVRRAAASLVPVLSDSEGPVRRAAATALSRLGWNPESDSERALRAVALAQWEEAASLGLDGARALAGALRDPARKIRAEVARVLRPLAADVAVRDLVSEFGKAGPDVSSSQDAIGLAWIGDVRAVRPLLRELTRMGRRSGKYSFLNREKVSPNRVNSVMFDAQNIVDALGQVLEHAGVHVHQEDLEAAADLGYSFAISYNLACSLMEEMINKKTCDLSLVRQFARQELARRGVERE